MSETRWIGGGVLKPLSALEQAELGYPYSPKQYRFWNEPDNRLTLIHDDVMYRIQDDTIVNLGSIPKIIQIIPGFEKDRYPWSYSMHDAGYHCGEDYCHKLWISRDKGVTWNFETVTRDQMDALIKPALVAEDCPNWRANCIREAVRYCGWVGWR